MLLRKNPMFLQTIILHMFGLKTRWLKPYFDTPTCLRELSMSLQPALNLALRLQKPKEQET